MEGSQRISFIIPCYNSEKYIVECIDSLYSQSLPDEDFEIIAVNDCSSDNTKEILSRYQKTHVNLTIIDHIQNKGQGGGRNTGLLHAKAEYIWYIDHDDFLLPNSVISLLNLLEKHQLDFIQFYYTEVNQKSEFIADVKTVISRTDISSGLDFVHNIGTNFLNNYNMSIWSRIYNREFLVKGKFLFEEIGVFEDLEYSLRTLLFANKIKLVEENPICYRIHSASTMRIFERITRGDLMYFSSLRSGLSMVRLGNELIFKDVLISKLMIEGGIWRINSFTKSLLRSTGEQRKLFYSLVQKNENIKELYKLSNTFNYLLLRYPNLSSIILFLVSPLYRIAKKYKVNRKGNITK